MSTVFQKRVAALPLLATVAALSACAAPDLGPRPELRTPQALESTRSLAGGEAGAIAGNWPADRWWTSYGDAQLDALVDEALAGSPDVAAAVARIRMARGAEQVTGAATLPQLNGQGSAGFTKQSYNNGVPEAFVPKGWNSTGTMALSGDFDLDLWGQNRKALAAATSEAAAAEADAQQARLLISSNVVASYFDLARLLEREKALADALDARETVARLTDQRVQQGLDNQSPLRQARAEVSISRAEIAANQQAIAARRHALAALMGAGPDRGLSIVPPAIASIPETALPADAGIALAGRRPDIVAARLRVEAAGSRIDSAKAAYMPDISLRGLIGLTSLGLSNLIDSGSTYGNAGGAISLPIFQGGRLSGQFTQARGGYDLAVADYNRTVAGALQEIADGISGREAARVQERETLQAQVDSEAAYNIAMQRYRGGIGNYLSVLVSQQVAINSRTAAIDSHFRTLAQEVALKRALGGGYADTSNEKAPIDE